MWVGATEVVPIFFCAANKLYNFLSAPVVSGKFEMSDYLWVIPIQQCRVRPFLQNFAHLHN